MINLEGVRSFLFGIGTGLILLSLVFYLVISTNEEKFNINTRAISSITDKELADRARELGMVFQSELEIGNSDVSDEFVIQRAIDLGMIFDESEPPISDSEQQVTDEQVAVEEQVQYVTVDIPLGSSAQRIATILQQNGVIDSANSYLNYLTDVNATTALSTGVFELPLNNDFDTITRILIAR